MFRDNGINYETTWENGIQKGKIFYYSLEDNMFVSGTAYDYKFDGAVTAYDMNTEHISF